MDGPGPGLRLRLRSSGSRREPTPLRGSRVGRRPGHRAGLVRYVSHSGCRRLMRSVVVVSVACLCGHTRDPEFMIAWGPPCAGAFGRLSHHPRLLGSPGRRPGTTAVAAPPAVSDCGGPENDPCCASRAIPVVLLAPCSPSRTRALAGLPAWPRFEPSKSSAIHAAAGRVPYRLGYVHLPGPGGVSCSWLPRTLRRTFGDGCRSNEGAVDQAVGMSWSR